jgi:NADH dehydrogenase [ubiquinone] 1 alpha subcomplex assembly factor 7
VSTRDLGARLARYIRAHGPISIAAFMAMALHDPKLGYYARRRPIGAAGDFITAPEISQVFGELIGLWCAEQWQRLGQPNPVVVAELGPGRGTLMMDFLRAAASVPGFRSAMRLHLVETSGALRDEQRQRLGDAAPVWIGSFDELPEEPLLLVANEFLDALPVRQLVRGRRDWRERLVAVDDSGGLVFADGPESSALSLLIPAARRDVPAGTIVEICPAAAALAAALGERLYRQPGAALFIDYGYTGDPAGPTLAASACHRASGVLDRPGGADLSAHVDFTAFAAAIRDSGATVHGPIPQGRFLTSLGAEARVASLLQRAAPEQRAALASGLQRLIDPGKMGTLFKALAVTSPGLSTPSGCDV